MRDELLKNNIIKAEKAIVDMGSDSTKILEVSYTSKTINIEEAYMLPIGFDTDRSFEETAKKVSEKLSGRKRRDIIVSLPPEITESKIISVKNKTDKEAAKTVQKQCRAFGKTNSLTHIVNASLLGTREEQGDTVMYYLVSSVQKSVMHELVDAFSDFGMKITRVVSSAFNQVCLSEIFADDYDNINRILVDFGNKQSRITVIADKVAVYSRAVPIGFQSYVQKLFDANNVAGRSEIISALVNVGEANGDSSAVREKLFNIGEPFYYESISEINRAFFKEFERILDMCGNSDINISKVYISGYVINGFVISLMNNTELECELIRFDNDEMKAGHGIIIDVQTENPLECRFSNAVGLSFCPLL